jgi:hypothetical protein
MRPSDVVVNHECTRNGAELDYEKEGTVHANYTMLDDSGLDKSIFTSDMARRCWPVR